MTEPLAVLLGPVLGATTHGTPWSALAMSFGLGLRHATEADHVVAVTTMATGTRSLRAAGRIGVLWGLGHSATVLVVGAIVLSFGRTMPDAVVRLFEGAAGLMLLALAAWSLRAPRAIYGSGAVSSAGAAPGTAGPRDARRSFLVGTVHGLAGSAAVAHRAGPRCPVRHRRWAPRRDRRSPAERADSTRPVPAASARRRRRTDGRPRRASCGRTTARSRRPPAQWRSARGPRGHRYAPPRAASAYPWPSW